MEINVNNRSIELINGDIASQKDIDAVVNAANAQLSGGGGVDGALHRAAGSELKKASMPLGPISPGEAVITDGFNLPNDYVIHCLGPVYGQDQPEQELLANCYSNALDLAEENNIQTIAFPSISTGAFGYPMDQAAEVALQAVINKTAELSSIQLIRMVLYGSSALETYEQALQNL